MEECSGVIIDVVIISRKQQLRNSIDWFWSEGVFTSIQCLLLQATKISPKILKFLQLFIPKGYWQ